MSHSNNKNLNKKIKTIVGATITAGAITLSLLVTPKIVLAKETGCTISDLVTYSAFERELSSIEHENHIEFQNAELYHLLNEQSGYNLTIEYLQSITRLELEIPLSNNDLSDLKYLPNLSTLEICGMNIDCSDLKYNQKLKVFNALDGTITNLNELPNTITTLSLQGITTPDNVIYVPYHTSSLDVSFSAFNKIYFKNPEELKSLTFSGYALFDLNDIKNCSNLHTISITKCPNISSKEVLTRMPNLQNLSLDDYACIWLDNDTLSKLPVNENSKKEYASYIAELDSIAKTLTEQYTSDKDKLNAIILYITNSIDYDIRVSEQQSGYKSLVADYNDEPIQFALNDDIGICVNYACLFNALASRAALDTYQPDSSTHTWNMVRLNSETEYKAYDTVGLDFPELISYLTNNATEELTYYGFDLNNATSEDFITNICPTIINHIITETGYLKPDNLKVLQSQLFVLVTELIALYIGLNIKIRNAEKKEAQNTKTFKYKRVEKN